MDANELLIFVVWITVLMMFQGGILIFLFWLLRRRQVWSLIKFAIKGGSLVLKGYPDNTIEIMQTKKPKVAVEWEGIDRVTGKKKKMYTHIRRVYHTLKGTSYPIHFCPFTFPTNINILTKEKAKLNQEEITALMAMEYNQGKADTMITGKLGGFPIDKATLMLLFIVGALIIVLIVMNLQVLEAVNA